MTTPQIPAMMASSFNLSLNIRNGQHVMKRSVLFFPIHLICCKSRPNILTTQPRTCGENMCSFNKSAKQWIQTCCGSPPSVRAHAFVKSLPGHAAIMWSSAPRRMPPLKFVSRALNDRSTLSILSAWPDTLGIAEQIGVGVDRPWLCTPRSRLLRAKTADRSPIVTPPCAHKFAFSHASWLDSSGVGRRDQLWRLLLLLFCVCRQTWSIMTAAAFFIFWHGLVPIMDCFYYLRSMISMHVNRYPWI